MQKHYVVVNSKNILPNFFHQCHHFAHLDFQLCHRLITPNHTLLPTSAQPSCTSSRIVKPITQHNPPNHSTTFVNTNVINCSSNAPKSPPPFISHNTGNATFNWRFNHPNCSESLPLDPRECVFLLFVFFFSRRGGVPNVPSPNFSTNYLISHPPLCSVDMTLDSWSVVTLKLSCQTVCLCWIICSSSQLCYGY